MKILTVFVLMLMEISLYGGLQEAPLSLFHGTNHLTASDLIVVSTQPGGPNEHLMWDTYLNFRNQVASDLTTGTFIAKVGGNGTNNVFRYPVSYNKTNFYGPVSLREPSWVPASDLNGQLVDWIDHSNMVLMTIRHNTEPQSEGAIFNHGIYFGGPGDPFNGGPKASFMSLQVSGGIGYDSDAPFQGDPRISLVFHSDTYTSRFRELSWETGGTLDGDGINIWEPSLYVGKNIISHNNIGDVLLAATGTRDITFVDPASMVNQEIFFTIDRFDQGLVTRGFKAISGSTTFGSTNFTIGASSATAASSFVGCLSNIFNIAGHGNRGAWLGAYVVQGTNVSISPLSGTKDIGITVGAGMTTASGTNGTVKTLGSMTAQTYYGDSSHLTNVSGAVNAALYGTTHVAADGAIWVDPQAQIVVNGQDPTVGSEIYLYGTNAGIRFWPDAAIWSYNKNKRWTFNNTDDSDNVATLKDITVSAGANTTISTNTSLFSKRVYTISSSGSGASTNAILMASGKGTNITINSLTNVLPATSLSSGTNGSWLFASGTSANATESRNNDIWVWGYNVTSSGGQANTNLAQLSWALEDYLEQPSPKKIQQEYYATYAAPIGPNGASFTYRPFRFFTRTNYSQMDINTYEIHYGGPYGTNDQWLTLQDDSANGGGVSILRGTQRVITNHTGTAALEVLGGPLLVKNNVASQALGAQWLNSEHEIYDVAGGNTLHFLSFGNILFDTNVISAGSISATNGFNSYGSTNLPSSILMRSPNGFTTEVRVAYSSVSNHTIIFPPDGTSGVLVTTNTTGSTNVWKGVPLATGQYLTYNGTVYVASNLPPSSATGIALYGGLGTNLTVYGSNTSSINLTLPGLTGGSNTLVITGTNSNSAFGPNGGLHVGSLTAVGGSNIVAEGTITANGGGTNLFGPTVVTNNLNIIGGSQITVSTNLAQYTTTSNPTNQFTTGVLYTNVAQRSLLVGSAVLNGGVSGSANITLLYTNNSVGYQLPMQTGAGVATTDQISFCVPLGPSAVYTFVSTMGTGASGSLTNVIQWQQ